LPAPSVPAKPAHSPLRASRRADLLAINLCVYA
jgi:hypothetical protein